MVPSATAFSARTRDGLRLHVRRFDPAGTPRGSILFIHGGCEHGGRYLPVASACALAGWTVLLPDHRGHGLSEGVRTDARAVRDYLDDLVDLERAHLPGGTATIYFGHSFGGLLAIRLAQLVRQPQALVLSAPLLRLLLPVPRWKQWLGRGLVAVAPTTRFRTHIDPRNMTRDPVRLEQRLADPLLQRSVTARWFFAMQSALHAAWRDASRLTCPTVIMQGLADRTVDPAAAAPFLDRTSCTVRDLWTYPEHVHEILQESDSQASVERMLSWIDQHVPAGRTA